MTQSRSAMRLFDGHQKMEQASLKKIFLMLLGNIFSIKTYLVANLPVMAAAASFKDLKNAISENVDDIKVQLLRMQEIYNIIGDEYHPRQCLGIRALTMEAFTASKVPGMSNLETDLTMLYHLYAMETLEMASYKSLHDLAQSMPNSEMTLLLKQNLDMAKDTKELYEMVIKEYVN